MASSGSRTVRVSRIDEVVLFEVAEAISALADPREQRREELKQTPHAKLQDGSSFGPLGVKIRLDRWTTPVMSLQGGPSVAATRESVASVVPRDAISYDVRFIPFRSWAEEGLPDSVQLEVDGHTVKVYAHSYTGRDVEPLMGAVADALSHYPYVPPEPPPAPVARVFIGHGGSRAWEVVRDYLQAEGVEVVTFETDERAGFATLSVVADLVRSARLAVVVMTKANEMVDGNWQARPNVIHEVGFSQGALGVENTLILLEDGCEEFTNIAGLTQIRFATGEIHTTKEKVLNAIRMRREAGWNL